MATRRRRGTGSLYFRNGDRRWVGVIETRTPGQRGSRTRKTIVGPKFCDVLRKLSDLQPPRPEVEGRNRTWQMRDAKSIATHTASEWYALVRQVERRCFYCGIETRGRWRYAMQKDHKTPISRGGSDGIDNLAVACQTCNLDKHDMTASEYVAFRHETGGEVAS